MDEEKRVIEAWVARQMGGRFFVFNKPQAFLEDDKVVKEVPLRFGEDGPIVGTAKIGKDEEGNYVVEGEITGGVSQQFRGTLGKETLRDNPCPKD